MRTHSTPPLAPPTCETGNRGEAVQPTFPRLLALDPGHSTGWCAFAEQGDAHVSGFGTLGPYNYETGLDGLALALVNLKQRYKPDVIVIERLPRSLTQFMRAIHDIVGFAVFPPRALVGSGITSYERYEVGPGEWKPVMKAKKVPVPFAATTQHEKDAYRMGAYWLMMHGHIPHTEIFSV